MLKDTDRTELRNEPPISLASSRFNTTNAVFDLSSFAKLVIIPRTTLKQEEFRAYAPIGSVALDGAVSGRTRYSPRSLHYNFNHHERCDRTTTPSSTKQVMMAILNGYLTDLLSRSKKTPINLIINDCDQDVCFATYILTRPDIVTSSSAKQRLDKLSLATDELDRKCGLINRDLNDPIYKIQAWIFEPYVTARMSGKLFSMDAQAQHRIIIAVHERLDRYFAGSDQQTELNTEFKIIYKSNRWSMVQERGPYARLTFLANGISAFISYQGSYQDRHRYSLARESYYVDFPIAEICNAANELENLPRDLWGGGSLCAGSPRAHGSSLNPKQLVELVNRIFK